MRNFPYLPFNDGPFRLAMGLMALKPEDWIEIDSDYEGDLAEKRRLLAARRDEVFAALPVAETACRELRDGLIDHLVHRFGAQFQRQGASLTNRLTGETWDLVAAGLHPLDLAGRQVQEDFCVLQADDAGRYRLTAASLCFPTRWLLQEKLGHPMSAIHDPVPGYGETLGRPVDRFMGLLKADKPVWRLNWSLNDSGALFQPSALPRPAEAAITPATVEREVHLRVERQTLRRLPETRAIVFGIRIYQTPLAWVTARPEVAARLAAAIRALPPETLRYKSIAPFVEAVLQRLEAAAIDPA